jgi:hypothetical protein
MSAPNPSPSLKVDTIDTSEIRDHLASGREAVSRLLFAGRMLGEGYLTPDAERDIVTPALFLNDLLCRLECVVNLDRTEWPFWGPKDEGSDES